MSREKWDAGCERGILALALAMLVFAPLAFGAVYAWTFLVLQALTLGVLILWGARLWLAPNPKLLWPPLAWVMLAAVVYAVGRYLTADIEYVARMEMIQVVLFAFLFLALINNLHGQEETTIICFTLIALGAVISGYALVQYGRHSNLVWNELSPYPGRASGTYISPNNLAGLLAMLTPLALAYVLVGKMKALTRVMLGYAALMMLAGLVVTYSRGGWLAAAAGTLLLLGVLLGHRNHRLKVIVLLAGLLVFVGFGVPRYLSKTPTYQQRVAHPGEEAALAAVDSSKDSRLVMWGAAARMWREHPWWGVGPAHFDYRFREYRPEIVQARPDRVHNDYLNLLVDWGVAGGVIALAGMAAFAWGLGRTWPHVRKAETDFGRGLSNRFAFFLGGTCGLVALAVHSFVDFNLHIPANALVGVTLLALVTSNLRFATTRFWFQARRPVRLAVTLMLLAAAAGLAAQGGRRSLETYWLTRADQQPFYSAERIALLKKAFAVEPKNFETAYAIGDSYRAESINGEANFAEQARTALDWLGRAVKLNPYDGYSYLRIGMCLDWLGQHGAETEAAYRQAEKLDPNGYFTAGNIGWHYVQTGDYAAAEKWFTRSLRLLSTDDNDIAWNYLRICWDKLASRASGAPQLPEIY